MYDCDSVQTDQKLCLSDLSLVDRTRFLKELFPNERAKPRRWNPMKYIKFINCLQSCRSLHHIDVYYHEIKQRKLYIPRRLDGQKRENIKILLKCYVDYMLH
jgi:hypothetical protein